MWRDEKCNPKRTRKIFHTLYIPASLTEGMWGKKKTTSEKHLVTKQMFYFESQTLRFINEDYY